MQRPVTGPRDEQGRGRNEIEDDKIWGGERADRTERERKVELQREEIHKKEMLNRMRSRVELLRENAREEKREKFASASPYFFFQDTRNVLITCL